MGNEITDLKYRTNHKDLRGRMAISLEFIDFLVRISTIKNKYPGGWEQCLQDHAPLIGGRVWFDDHLFRDGAMNPQDIKQIVDRWSGLGFETMGYHDGRPVWKDVCVIESLFGGPTLPCEWIVFDNKQRIAYLKGATPGNIIRREQQ